MHLRRALLLFAIVLVLAALVASLSAPEQDDNGPAPAPSSRADGPSASPGPTGDATPRPLRFSDGGKARTRTLATGAPGVVEVSVRTPGLVTIPSLGLTEDAEPGTPATLDVLSEQPAEHEIEVTPAGTEEPRRVGVLVIER